MAICAAVAKAKLAAIRKQLTTTDTSNLGSLREALAPDPHSEYGQYLLG